MDNIINLTWEYLTEKTITMERLNELGADGWELVGFNKCDDRNTCAMESIAILKRPRIEREEQQPTTETAYWYNISELEDRAIHPNEYGLMPPLRFNKGCGLHPFSVYKDKTELERYQGEVKRGFHLKAIAYLAEGAKNLPQQMKDLSDDGKVAFLFPYRGGYINTWNGRQKPNVRISYDRIESTLETSAYPTILQTLPEGGFDNIIES